MQTPQRAHAPWGLLLSSQSWVDNHRIPEFNFCAVHELPGYEEQLTWPGDLCCTEHDQSVFCAGASPCFPAATVPALLWPKGQELLFLPVHLSPSKFLDCNVHPNLGTRRKGFLADAIGILEEAWAGCQPLQRVLSALKTL